MDLKQRSRAPSAPANDVAWDNAAESDEDVEDYVFDAAAGGDPDEEEAAPHETSDDEEDAAASDDEDTEAADGAQQVRLPRLPPGDRKTVIVHPTDRITSHRLTTAEAAAAIAIRARAIEKKPTVFTDIGDLSSPIEIARKEFYDKRSPLLVHRSVGHVDGVEHFEVWAVREMTLPDV